MPYVLRVDGNDQHRLYLELDDEASYLHVVPSLPFGLGTLRSYRNF